MPIEIAQFTCRSDNFGVLIHDASSRETALIDAPEEKPILEAIERTGWRPSLLLVTHHHADHVEANEALKKRFGLKIVGPKKEAAKIPGIDETVDGGSTFRFGGDEVKVLFTPGHTLGHISYHFPTSRVAFVADVLFAMGCGRIIEGDAPMMWQSLQQLAALPPETTIYCGHEYTQANAKFALAMEPGNADLQARAKEVERLRADKKPTLPTTIAEELATNPFLRPQSHEIRKTLDMANASDEAVFAETRRRKDNF